MKQVKLWSIAAILLVAGVQAAYILATTNQILFEELLESVRSPYWVMNGRLFNTISRHVGWYAQLALIYKIFGFSLYTVKIYRLVLTLLSMWSIYQLFKKYTKQLTPILILIWGLSPTLLYFTAHGGDYGLDSQIIPILALILFYLPKVKGFWTPLAHFAFFFLLAGSVFTFSTFFFYIPAFLIGYTYLFRSSWRQLKPKTWLAGVLGVITPPLGVIFAIKDGIKLFTLPGPQHLNPNLITLYKNILIVIRDVFAKGYGYNYILPKTEFYWFFPFGALILGMIFLYLNRAKINFGWRLWLICALITFATNLFTVNYLIDVSMHPGIRRNTPALMALYSPVPLLIYLYIFKRKLIKAVAIVPIVLLMLTLHHIIIIPENYTTYRHLEIFYYNRWFGSQVAASPTLALKKFTDQITKHDVILNCTSDDPLDPNYCRYEELYAAIKLYCLHQPKCFELKIVDPRSAELKTLELDYWPPPET